MNIKLGNNSLLEISGLPKVAVSGDYNDLKNKPDISISDRNYINSEINKVNEQLETKANKNEVFSMANMGQDIKTAMTGGSVAVVGDEMVLPNNIARNGVTQSNLSNDLRQELTSLNTVSYSLNATQGYYDINLAFIANVNYTTTMPIACNLGDEIIVNQCVSGTSAYYCCLLDINKNPITVINKGDGASLAKEMLYKINNNNAKYIVFTTSTGRVSSFYVKKLGVKPINENITGINNEVINLKNALSDFTECEYTENTQNGYFIANGTLTTTTQTSYRNTLKLSTQFGDKWQFKSYGIGTSAYQVVEYDVNGNVLGAYIQGTGSTTIYTIKQHSVVNQNTKFIAFGYYNADMVLYKNMIVDIDTKINSSNSLYGKTIVGMGDSLMYGMGLSRDEPWIALCGIKNNMSYYNCGVNGKKIAGTDGVANEFETLLTTNNVPNDIDYIVIDGGANDNAQGIQIGTNSDMTVDTFKGAMNVLIGKILSKYPTVKVLFLTNYNRYAGDINFVDAMLEMCNLYSIPCYDNYRKSGINFLNPNGYHTARNLIFENQTYKKHFSADGYKYLLPIYENLLKGI